MVKLQYFRKIKMARRKYIDLEYNRIPKYMSLSCFRIFSKRYENNGATQRCTCGNDALKRLDPEIEMK